MRGVRGEQFGEAVRKGKDKRKAEDSEEIGYGRGNASYSWSIMSDDEVSDEDLSIYQERAKRDGA